MNGRKIFRLSLFISFTARPPPPPPPPFPPPSLPHTLRPTFPPILSILLILWFSLPITFHSQLPVQIIRRGPRIVIQQVLTGPRYSQELVFDLPLFLLRSPMLSIGM